MFGTWRIHSNCHNSSTTSTAACDTTKEMTKYVVLSLHCSLPPRVTRREKPHVVLSFFVPSLHHSPSYTTPPYLHQRGFDDNLRPLPRRRGNKTSCVESSSG